MKRLGLLLLLAAGAAFAGDIILRNAGTKVAPVSQIDCALDGGMACRRDGGVGLLYCSAASYNDPGCVTTGTQVFRGNKTIRGTLEVDGDAGVFVKQISAYADQPLDIYGYGIDNSALNFTRIGSYEASTSHLNSCLVEVGYGFAGSFTRQACFTPQGDLRTNRVSAVVLDAGYAGIGILDAGTVRGDVSVIAGNSTGTTAWLGIAGHLGAFTGWVADAGSTINRLKVNGCDGIKATVASGCAFNVIWEPEATAVQAWGNRTGNVWSEVSTIDLYVGPAGTGTLHVAQGGVNSTSCTLNGASPSTCTATVLASSKCVCSPVGTTAAIAAGGCAVSLSGTTLTLTGPNGATNDVNVWCTPP